MDGSSVRRLGAREVGRRIADVLDEVELELAEFIITRDGRPVARIVPIDATDGIRRSGRRQRSPVKAVDQAVDQVDEVAQDDADDVDVELTPLQVRLLGEVASHPGHSVMPACLEKPRDWSLSMYELEKEGSSASIPGVSA